MKTLIINGYAGSLALGATAAGHEIIGAYEDAGYGMPVLRANFNHFPTIENRRDWPTSDLSGSIVIAHPPCSAFSGQNSVAAHRGINAAAFSCTREVMEYGLGNRADALAVESVSRAMEGAWAIHEDAANRHGYDLFRIKINSVVFCPQWRERFWAVFVRRGILPQGQLAFGLVPKRVTVGDIMLKNDDEGVYVGGTEKLLEKLAVNVVREFGPEMMQRITTNPNHIGPLRKLIATELKMPHDEIYKKYTPTSSFMTKDLVWLNKGSYTNVLLSDSWWYAGWRDRMLFAQEYKRIMGYPTDYVFPGKLESRTREFLSKGVCPPVATWICNTLQLNLEASNAGLTHRAESGSVINLLFKKAEYDEACCGDNFAPMLRGCTPAFQEPLVRRAEHPFVAEQFSLPHV